ncbi:MAG: hypothetical protein ACLTD4_08730 [Hungatella sp.]
MKQYKPGLGQIWFVMVDMYVHVKYGYKIFFRQIICGQAVGLW